MGKIDSEKSGGEVDAAVACGLGVRTFSNDRSLSAEQIDMIVRWVDHGAVRGDPADMPETPVFPPNWREGEPDYILEFGEVVIAAGGEDDYRYKSAAFETSGDKWVRAIELQPSNRNVAHHAVVY